MSSFYRKKVEQGELGDGPLAKWSYPVLDEGFVPFPKRLLRCLPRVFAGPHAVEDIAVALAIVDYKKPFKAPPPSLDFLAFLAGMEIDSFRQGLGRLVESGYARVNVVGDDRITVDLSGLHAMIEEQTAEPEWTSSG